MVHHLARNAAAVGALLLVTGCSSSGPTAPDPAAARMDLLPPGAYTLLISTGPEHAATCRAEPPRPLSQVAIVAIVRLTIAHDGQTWVARAADAADGDIELRLRQVRDDVVLGSQVYTAMIEGTIRGSALMAGGLSFGDRVVFGPAADTLVQGTVTRSATGLGTMTGEIVQANSATAVSCPVVRWTLSRGAIPEL